MQVRASLCEFSSVGWACSIPESQLLGKCMSSRSGPVGTMYCSHRNQKPPQGDLASPACK